MSMFNYIVEDATPSNEALPATPEFDFQPPATLTEEEPQGKLITERFYENPDQIQDEKEYPRRGKDAGLVVIFNQQHFDDSKISSRSGTNRDVNELCLTFSRLGFNVSKENVHNDFTRGQILEELNKLSERDHTDSNCLIIVLLTHGNRDNVLEARDAQLFTYEIWEPFTANKCKSLARKPKFFIFQACKGENFSKHDSAADVDIIPAKIYTTLGSDMLVAFSAVEGSQSQRHTFLGTWFIQEICKNFAAFGRRDDVVSLLIRTSKCVTRNYYHEVADGEEKTSPIKKQMPLFVSTLRKKFYLSRSKDRTYTLENLKQMTAIEQNLNELCKDIKHIRDGKTHSPKRK